MALEVETKILDINSAIIEERLKALGAKKVFDGILTQELYCKEGFPGHYRIREDGEKIVVALKTKTGRDTAHAKVRDEREKVVDSKEQARQDAKKLGFAYDKTTKKHRVEYKHENVAFAIDTYDDIPPFLEIEADNEEDVLAWAEKLGFPKRDLKPWSGKQLRKHYSTNNL